jgi:predicted DNA-binding protein (MmcQ/YjbR family)
MARMEHPILDLKPWMHLIGPLREICLALPEAHEGLSFGSPWFRAGKKPFAIFDVHDGRPELSFRAVPEARDELLADARIRPTPYMWHNGWVSLDLDEPVDWEEVEELVVDSYRQQALKRMLQALEG